MVHIVLSLLKRTGLLFYCEVGPIPAGGGLPVRRQGRGVAKVSIRGRAVIFSKSVAKGLIGEGGLCYAALPIPTNKRNEWVTGRVNAVSRCPRSDGVHVLVHVQLPANRFQLALLLTP